jgi:hypothetical protein
VDGDGRLDLLLGSSGAVFFFRNVGTRTAPHYESATDTEQDPFAGISTAGRQGYSAPALVPLDALGQIVRAALRDAGLLEITEFITDFDAEALGARSTWDVSDRLGFADAGGDAATDDAITEKEGSSSPSSAAALYDRFRFLRPTAATAAVRVAPKRTRRRPSIIT